jgi:hypothetical protein
MLVNCQMPQITMIIKNAPLGALKNTLVRES